MNKKYQWIIHKYKYHKGIHQLNRPITKNEIEYIIKTFPTKNKMYNIRWLPMQILQIIQRGTYSHSSLSFPNCWRKTPKDILWNHHHPTTKTRQRYHQKKKIVGQYLWGIQMQNFSAKFYPPESNNVYKISYTRSSEIHPRFTKMVQHMQINQPHTPH